MSPKPSIPDPHRASTGQGIGQTAGLAYHEVLNPAQLAAATFGEGPLLVIAGAGSGKTRTLTYRVARLVEDGVRPETILLLSFTRKASQEMLNRAARLLDHRCQRVAGGTFHSFANSVLRQYAHKIGFAHGFVIIDRADSEDLIGMIRPPFSVEPSTSRFPSRKLFMKTTPNLKPHWMPSTLYGKHIRTANASTIFAILTTCWSTCTGCFPLMKRFEINWHQLINTSW